MRKDKLRLIVMSILAVVLLGGVALYAFTAISRDGAELGDFVTIPLVLAVIIFMAFFVSRRYKDVKKGMPLEDERSKKVLTQAAAKSFYVTLYWLLFISWFEGPFARLFGVGNLDASQTVGGGIAGMTLFFFIFWLYYDRKGKLN